MLASTFKKKTSGRSDTRHGRNALVNAPIPLGVRAQAMELTPKRPGRKRTGRAAAVRPDEMAAADGTISPAGPGATRRRRNTNEATQSRHGRHPLARDTGCLRVRCGAAFRRAARGPSDALYHARSDAERHAARHLLAPSASAVPRVLVVLMNIYHARSNAEGQQAWPLLAPSATGMPAVVSQTMEHGNGRIRRLIALFRGVVSRRRIRYERCSRRFFAADVRKRCVPLRT